jgi:hypothetical protein
MPMKRLGFSVEALVSAKDDFADRIATIQIKIAASFRISSVQFNIDDAG